MAAADSHQFAIALCSHTYDSVTLDNEIAHRSVAPDPDSSALHRDEDLRDQRLTEGQ
jgi:hypothetical protein